MGRSLSDSSRTTPLVVVGANRDVRTWNRLDLVRARLGPH